MTLKLTTVVSKGFGFSCHLNSQSQTCMYHKPAKFFADSSQCSLRYDFVVIVKNMNCIEAIKDSVRHN